MLKKQFYLLIIILFSFQNLLTADQASNVNRSIECSKPLQPAFKKILQVPELNALVESILKEGPLHIKVQKNTLSERFGACWDKIDRTIFVYMNSQTTEGEVIGSIIFELQNAAANSKFKYYDQLAANRKIKKQAYVESIEYIEYQNSLKAASMTTKGINAGILPRDALLPTYESFAEYLRYQKIGNHSEWIGSSYDQLAILYA